MRPLLGFIAANALLLFAGTGILVALRVVRLRARELIAAGGLAFLCGLSAVMVIATLALVVGIPMRLASYAAICLVLAIGGPLLARRRPANEIRHAHGENAPFGASRLRFVAAAGFAAALVTVIVVIALRAREARVVPVSYWDEFAIWSKKAVFLFNNATLDPTFFAGAPYVHMHQDYPLLLPLLEAFVFRAMGTPAARPMHVEFVVLLVAFLWAIGYLGWRRRPSFVWAPVLLAVAVSPWVWDQLLTGYADLPVTFLLGAGVLSLGLWFEEPRREWLVVAAVLLAGAANTKMEGLAAGGAALVVAAMLSWSKRQPRSAAHAGLALVALGLAVLPWRLWTSAHDVHLYLDLGKGLDVSYLWHARDTATGTLRFLGLDLADENRLLLVVPLALALVVLCFAMGVQRRLAGFYLATALVQLAFLTWVNVLDSNSLSVGRSIDTVAVFAIVAVVHLASALSSPSHARGFERMSSSAGAAPPAPDPVTDAALSTSATTLGANRGSRS
jgi:hypothetical protein